jgi:hypothetical protein
MNRPQIYYRLPCVIRYGNTDPSGVPRLTLSAKDALKREYPDFELQFTEKVSSNCFGEYDVHVTAYSTEPAEDSKPFFIIRASDTSYSFDLTDIEKLIHSAQQQLGEEYPIHYTFSKASSPYGGSNYLEALDLLDTGVDVAVVFHDWSYEPTDNCTSSED